MTSFLRWFEMTSDTLFDAGVGPLFVGTVIVLLVAGELGFRYARARSAAVDDHWRTQATSIQAATLGLLALLLGFTFSIAVQRFDARRALVVDEANAIGTAYLRVDVLPAAVQPEMRQLLREYTDLRLRAFSGVILDENAARLDRESQQLQERMWAHVSAAAASDPHSVAAGLMLQATNEVIDLHTARLTSRRAHIPGVVILLLGLVSCASIAFVSFSHGLGATRRSGGVPVLVVLVASSLTLILDLDRPRQGLVRVSQEPMRMLLESME